MLMEAFCEREIYRALREDGDVGFYFPGKGEEKDKYRTSRQQAAFLFCQEIALHFLRRSQDSKPAVEGSSSLNKYFKTLPPPNMLLPSPQ
ncbi:hypothetical protein Leryth_010108 [Lithospermum erythrorhizon]|nr:hypothetical protein Leryth_010108 [Lithospermum erythrorhizon]